MIGQPQTRWAKAASLPISAPVLVVARALDHDFARHWKELAEAELILAESARTAASSDGDDEPKGLDAMGAAVIVFEPELGQASLMVWSIASETRGRLVASSLLDAIAVRATKEGCHRILAILFTNSPSTDFAFAVAKYQLLELLPDGRMLMERRLA
jgi:hypothetical protein